MKMNKFFMFVFLMMEIFSLNLDSIPHRYDNVDIKKMVLYDPKKHMRRVVEY